MAGFVEFEITWRKEVFDGAPQESSAASFETVGINYRARKPKDEAEWWAALNKLSCELPAAEEPHKSLLGADAFYDAGDLGCGYGPITEIAALLKELAIGQTLEVRATDPTVKVDLPAWARMAGHKLIDQKDDRYLLERK